MDSQPWLNYFKRSVGAPLVFSTQNRPVVINEKSKHTAVGQKNNLPIDVISPLEQNNRMAIAEMKGGKEGNIMKKQAVVKRKSYSKDARKKQGGHSAKKKSSSSTAKTAKSKKSSTKSTGSGISAKRQKKATALGDKSAVSKLTVTGSRAKDIFSKVRN